MGPAGGVGSSVTAEQIARPLARPSGKRDAPANLSPPVLAAARSMFILDKRAWARTVVDGAD